MTRFISSLLEIAADYDIAVLDQYGVLHDGRSPYAGAPACIQRLADSSKHIAILTNSGKRSDINRRRIERLGLKLPADAVVESSGEVAWNGFRSAPAPLPGPPPYRLLPVCAERKDAEDWAAGNDRLRLVARCDEADAVLLMGVPACGFTGAVREIFDNALAASLPVICTNPDRTSPEGGEYTLSPGVMADQYEYAGGRVIWYGKPHAQVFDAIRARFPDCAPGRFLMVGDSMLHDISGAAAAGFKTCFIRSGIHAPAFADTGTDTAIAEEIDRICYEADLATPDYSMRNLA
ncbi:MAG: TIGR01459 family HAD-type hydrolase [Rhodobacteraceae bacterium]|nr:TIGR01459 family HAD-type hydrolase [Paracoccaceae bacterium]